MALEDSNGMRQQMIALKPVEPAPKNSAQKIRVVMPQSQSAEAQAPPISTFDVIACKEQGAEELRRAHVMALP